MHYRLDPEGPALDPDLLSALRDVARITHGTDTLEETALFLALTIPPGKPVVQTAAMRPGGALGADGPRNLLGVARVAADPAAAGRGVLVVTDDQVIAAPSARKRHTTAVSAFRPEAEGLVGEVLSQRVVFIADRMPPLPDCDIVALTELPRVEILYCYQDLSAYLFDAVIAAGARGLVLACTGNGTLSETARRGVERAIGAGLVVVRSSGTGAGRATWTDAPGIAAGPLHPQQARLLLMLALARRSPVDAVEVMFRCL